MAQPLPPPPPTQESASPVEFIRRELFERLDQYQRIRAALDGEEAVKSLGEAVLPRPNPGDTSASNIGRYDGYLKRAVWYNVSGRTLAGMTGYVFTKEPVVKLPATLATMETNVDGAGVTLNQQAKEALRLILSLGRAGLLVDYPKTPQGATRQELLDGKIAPTIVLYEPDQITNWRTSYIGARQVLDKVVLKEAKQLPSAKNEFELVELEQYRVLDRTLEGVTGRIFRRDNATRKFEEVTEEAYRPLGQSGQPLKEIPFTFLGAVNNDTVVDTPPLLDMVNLNLAHFRNSADHEESCFLVGQPTPWVSGVTEGWVKDVWKGEIHLGSRAVIPLPVGGAAGLIQADPNTLPNDAMKHKEEQMVKIGAKLVEQDGPQKTATEANMDNTAEVSTLTSAATNMFLGYKMALQFAGQFVGTDTATIEFDLTEPLAKETFTPEMATAVMALWQGGIIDQEEARWALKKSGIAWKDDEKVKQAITDEGLPPNPNNPPPDPNAPPPKAPAAP